MRGAAVSDLFTTEQPPGLRNPPQDAANTTILTSHGTFAYWVLRLNGDCLIVRPLPRKPNSLEIVARELIESIAETLLNYRRLYANLGVTPRADLRIDIRIPTLPGTTLFVPASPYGGLHRKERTVLEGVSHIEEVVLGRIEQGLVALTRSFAEPLIAAFESSRLGDEVYEQIVNDFLPSVS
jgi:hypothetical protein